MAEALVMDAGGLAHTLKPLVCVGLIAIDVDPKDRRNRLIRLTRSGQAKLKESDALREVMRRLISYDFAQAFESALASAG
jgi:DNA-binding MarR family transcriptional regulator